MAVFETGGGASSEPQRPKKSKAEAGSRAATSATARAAARASPRRSGRFPARLLNANALFPTPWPSRPDGLYMDETVPFVKAVGGAHGARGAAEAVADR